MPDFVNRAVAHAARAGARHVRRDVERTLGQRATPKQQPSRNPLRDIGRNDPCPCGSGLKFKRCCGWSR